MLLVLDSNEYIFSFGPERQTSCVALLQKILKNPSTHVLRIARTTIDDVRKRVSHQAFPEFLAFLRDLDVMIDEDELVPYAFGGRYLARGLKPGDAFSDYPNPRPGSVGMGAPLGRESILETPSDHGRERTPAEAACRVCARAGR